LNVNIYLSDHLDIHILQLPFFDPKQFIRDDKDRWLYFFKEGHNIELKDLPENIKTKEIIKAMETLNHFSNDQRAYLLYQERLESKRVASTWQSLLRQKDSEIQRNISEIQKKDSEIQKRDSEIQRRDSEINQLKSLIRKYEKNQMVV